LNNNSDHESKILFPTTDLTEPNLTSQELIGSAPGLVDINL